MSREILDSINTVSELIQKRSVTSSPLAFAAVAATTLHSTETKAALTSIKTVSLAVNKTLGQLNKYGAEGTSYMKIMGVPRAEEAHSNLLAAALNPKVSGPVAFRFVVEILRVLNHLAPLDSNQAMHVFRERRLGSLGRSHAANSNTADRRIDILVDHPNLVMIIENKVDSDESENQTKDYYAAVSAAYKNRKHKKIVGVLLSPDGRAADCPDFQGLSYFSLYQALNKALVESLFEHGKYPLPWFYRDELYSIFVSPNIELAKRVEKYWKDKSK